MDGHGPAARVSVGPPADWINAPPFQPTAAREDQQIRDGRRFWWSDAQVDLRGGGQSWFSRAVVEAVTSDALSQVAAQSVEFDPEYQSVLIHHLRVIRDGVAREINCASNLQILRRELDLERARYDGRLTAHVTVPDVRVGDVVDFAFTVEGENPILRSKFGTELRLQWVVWVARTRVRILADADRDLIFEVWGPAPNPLRPAREGFTELLWDRLATPPETPEPDTPVWHRWLAMARVCDRMTWNQVADLFREPYGAPDRLPDELERFVEETAASAATPGERALTALHLVEDSLRYCAISIGDGGFVPRSIQHIWDTRSGDCKDASNLLAALLNRLGIEACPALVNTGTGERLADEPPMPMLFDHCIVRAMIDGQTVWFDPTRSGQGRRLETIHQPAFGWALPLIANSTLVAMSPPPQGQLVYECHERFVLGVTGDAPGTYESRTTYGSWRAENMRAQLAANGPVEVRRGMIDFLARIFGKVTSEGDIEVKDDPEANTIEMAERYGFERTWRLNDAGDLASFEVPDLMLGPNLPMRHTVDRRTPIDLGVPRRVRTVSIVDVPVDVAGQDWDIILEGPGMAVTSKCEQTGARQFTLTIELTVSASSIGAADAVQFFECVRKALTRTSLMVNLRIHGGGFEPSTPPLKFRGTAPATGAFSQPIIPGGDRSVFSGGAVSYTLGTSAHGQLQHRAAIGAKGSPEYRFGRALLIGALIAFVVAVVGMVLSPPNPDSGVMSDYTAPPPVSPLPVAPAPTATPAPTAPPPPTGFTPLDPDAPSAGGGAYGKRAPPAGMAPLK